MTSTNTNGMNNAQRILVEGREKLRLTNDEINTQLHLICTNLITFFETNNLENDLINELNELKSNNNFDLLFHFCESYGDIMAHINHDELLSYLVDGWDYMSLKLNLQRKRLNKRLHILEADKNTDINVLEQCRSDREKIQNDLARINVKFTHLKIMKTIPLS